MFAAVIVAVLSSVCFGYSGGSGEPNDPYYISDVSDLLELAGATWDYNKCFILTADINLTGQTFTQAPIAADTSTSLGFQGTQFTGIFDGNDHVITNLNIAASTKDYIGLFGYISSSGQVKNLGIENINVTGRSYVGGLAAYNNGTFTSCYATGSVSGHRIGGIAGYNSGTLTLCYATVSASGRYDIGGLIGKNNGTLTSCHATGPVNGTSESYSYDVGGLIGENSGGNLTSCYATGSVNSIGRQSNIGGLIGYDNHGSLTCCYSTGSVSGTGEHTRFVRIGGLVGINVNNDSTFTSCFWDTETSGQSAGLGSGTSTGITGKTTVQMKTLSTFTNAGWDFIGESANGLNDFWQMDVNDYPRLTIHGTFMVGDGSFANPYIIANTADLGRVWPRPSACYILVSNLDLAGISWSSAVIPGFTGIFDGQGFIIANLKINQPSMKCIGLFGFVRSGGEIKNLGIEDVNVAGYRMVGGLAGRCYYGTLTTCYVNGLVRGTYLDIGGLAGRSSYSTFTSCYTTCSVSGGGSIGGLAGNSQYNTITSCYSTGSVSGGPDDGGLLGYNSGTLTSCFWDKQSSGQSVGVGLGSSTGVTGKTTTEMQTKSTFTDAGWDFVGELANGTDDIWRMCVDGLYYPKLSWQFLLGDFVCPDGVEMSDLAALCEEWLRGELSADFWPDGGDGIVNFFDWAEFANQWQITVDYEGLADFTDQWLERALSTDIWPEGGDGIVNMGDFAVFANNWLKED